jgi:queuine/archaeosine tRNA-ribosyltransferase
MCPEVAFNSSGTIDAVVNFINKVPGFSLSAKLFGTVHGTSYQNVVQCYKEVSKLVDYVGFSYRIWCDDLIISYPNKTIERALMRINIIQKMVRDCYIEKDKPTHLLGISDPLEIIEQSKHSFIKSCDSSTAFIHGKNKVVFRERGLEGIERLEEKVNFGDTVGNPNLIEIIKHNISRVDLYGTGKVKDL